MPKKKITVKKKSTAKKTTSAGKKTTAKKKPATKKKTSVKKKAPAKKTTTAKNQVVSLPNITTPNNPVYFTEKCNGCNTCVETCQIDVFIPNPEKGKSPIILHPDECWYCGCCVNDCPRGGMEFNWALQHKGYWKNKQTGEVHQMPL